MEWPDALQINFPFEGEDEIIIHCNVQIIYNEIIR
jgi:hypothetical protein